jgi:hypothetical protein
VTDLEIQGFRDEHASPPPGAARRFELVHCPACGRSHIVEPTTGCLLSDATPAKKHAARPPLAV